MLDLSLAWPLHQKTVSSVIVGVTKPAQLKSNRNAIETYLPPNVIRSLDIATEKLKYAMGSNIDLWQGDDNSRCNEAMETR